MDRCPTHREYPAEDCPACERRIEDAEAVREGRDMDEGGFEARVAADRYEAWLDRCFEG